jgi:hypothetical protein
MRPATGSPDTVLRHSYAAAVGAIACDAATAMARQLVSADTASEEDCATSFGVLWGAVMAIARRHGETAALKGLVDAAERLGQPDFKPPAPSVGERADATLTRIGNVLGALLVETHPGPYVAHAAGNPERGGSPRQ